MDPKPIMAISATILAAGLALLILMVTTEGEPGALPLALILAGASGGYLGWRRR